MRGSLVLLPIRRHLHDLLVEVGEVCGHVVRPLGVLVLVATGGLLPSEVVALKASLHADALEVRLGRGRDGLQLERLCGRTVYFESNSQESPVTMDARAVETGWLRRSAGCSRLC